jgi:hypothetical protein
MTSIEEKSKNGHRRTIQKALIKDGQCHQQLPVVDGKSWRFSDGCRRNEGLNHPSSVCRHFIDCVKDDITNLFMGFYFVSYAISAMIFGSFDI